MIEVFGHVFWNYFAIGYLIVGVFATLSSVFAFSIREKSEATIHVGFFFAMAGLLSFAFCFAQAVYHTGAVYHRYFTILGALSSSIHILQFLLHFPSPAKKWVRAIMGLQWLQTIAIVGYFALQAFNLPRSYHFSAHLWDYDAEQLSSRVGLFIIFNALIFVFYGVYKVFKLKGRERWIVLGLVIAFLSATLVPGILNVLSREGVMDRDLFTTLFTILSVCACFAVIILFINNTSDRTTFMVKITGITLVTILLVFQIVTFFSLQSTDSSFDEIYRREGALFLRGEKSDKVQYAYTYIPVARRLHPPETSIEKRELIAREVPISGGASELDFGAYSQQYENTQILASISKLSHDDFFSVLDLVLDPAPAAFRGYATAIREFVRVEKNAGPEDVLAYLKKVEPVIAHRAFKIEQLPNDHFRERLEKYLSGTGKDFAPFRRTLEEHLRETRAEDSSLKL